MEHKLQKVKLEKRKPKERKLCDDKVKEGKRSTKGA